MTKDTKYTQTQMNLRSAHCTVVLLQQSNNAT